MALVALLQSGDATISTRNMNQFGPADTQLPDSAALAGALDAAGLAIDPSELHGLLCGYVAGGGKGDADDWLQRLALDVDDADSPDADAAEGGSIKNGLTNAGPGEGALAQLRTATLAQLAAHDFGFELLLPSDDAPLAERADALLGWCNGFLGGFGLAAPAPDMLSGEASEALQDMGRIAASDLAYEDSEADENALAEIVEFVRVAALLLHGDCVQGAQRKRQLH
jgi:uncharacterized protein YgfB (UPF0149 family)